MIIAIKEPGNELIKKEVSEEEFQVIKDDLLNGCWKHVYLSHPNATSTLVVLFSDDSFIDGLEYNFKFQRPVTFMLHLLFGMKGSHFSQEVYGSAVFVSCGFDEAGKAYMGDIDMRDVKAIKRLIRTGDMKWTIALTDYNAGITSDMLDQIKNLVSDNTPRLWS